MEIRNALHPTHSKQLTTEGLRNNFIIENLFQKGKINLFYTDYDRFIVGGICPDSSKELSLDIDKSIIGTDYLLARREMGIINIGGTGTITVEGKPYKLDKRDGLYIGMDTKEITFSSDDKNEPAKYYVNSVPAHQKYPTEMVSINNTEPQALGTDEKSNKRVIYKYFHPEGIKTCQLVMGMTLLEPNNVWNTMPPHTHQRRMEIYFYFDIPEDNVVFQMIGEPDETRHIIVRNEEAVIHPSWSIHSGVGTNKYSFIWGMAGENQTFSDMDHINMTELK
jgi:4-deoxy-L-threo-5-hexosulose-uronate ketol-isomerase